MTQHMQQHSTWQRSKDVMSTLIGMCERVTAPMALVIYPQLCALLHGPAHSTAEAACLVCNAWLHG